MQLCLLPGITPDSATRIGLSTGAGRSHVTVLLLPARYTDPTTMLVLSLLDACGATRLTPMNTWKSLHAMPLLFAAAFAQAEESPPAGPADLLALPQRLAGQTRAIMQEREAGLNKLSDAVVEMPATDPDAERRTVDETESFGRQHQPADEVITQ